MARRGPFILLMMTAGLGAIMSGAAPVLAAEYGERLSESPEDYNEADDAFLGGPDPPWMLPVGLLILFVLVTLLVAATVLGIVAAVVTLAVTAVLVSVGVVSLSAVVGLLSRRPSHAAKVFFIQLGSLSGIPCGIGSALLVTWLGNLGIHRGLAVLVGGVTGLGAGLVVALLFNLAWTRIVAWGVERFRAWKDRRAKKPTASPQP